MNDKNIIVVFLLFMPLALISQTLQLSSISLRTGSTAPSLAGVNAFSLGVRGETESGFQGLRLQPYIDYWAAQWKTNTIRWNWQLFSVGASAIRRFNNNYSKASPFVGGGIGVNLNIPKATSDNALLKTDKIDFDLSLHIIGGFVLPLNSNLSATMELKYVAGGRMDYTGLWLGVDYLLK